jgi:hypothetical protein
VLPWSPTYIYYFRGICCHQIFRVKEEAIWRKTVQKLGTGWLSVDKPIADGTIRKEMARGCVLAQHRQQLRKWGENNSFK